MLRAKSGEVGLGRDCERVGVYGRGPRLLYRCGASEGARRTRP
jgi:hypothetical protein